MPQGFRGFIRSRQYPVDYTGFFDAWIGRVPATGARQWVAGASHLENSNADFGVPACLAMDRNAVRRASSSTGW